ncbi:MAG: cell division protein FtsA [Nitrospirae bacterium]|nr:cell division protein FtsA [Nitrospirota bacterium]
MKRDKLIAGIDIGTTKVCAAVGELHEGRVNVLGIASALSRGIKKGVVVNIEETAQSIRNAVSEAQAVTGAEIEEAYVAITGTHIGNFISNGVIAIRDKEISRRDIEGVTEAAQALAIPLDREVLHVIPVGFTIDGQNGINDPLGMAGVRLEAKVQIITGAMSAVQNLLKSCQMAGLKVLDVVFAPLASSEAVLFEDEMDMGVGFVDIGGGTTDIAVFNEGSLRYMSVLPVGGSNFTNDVAMVMKLRASEAERIKKGYGCALLSMVSRQEEVEILHADNKPPRSIPKVNLIEILQPRAEEIFSLMKEEIRKSGYNEYLTSGIVLTGGSSLMKGIDLIAENILELPVRIGFPGNVNGMSDAFCSPAYATGVGLLLYGAKQEQRGFKSRAMFGFVMDRLQEGFGEGLKKFYSKYFGQ